MNCSIEGCGNVAAKRGWCNRHYLIWYRHGDVEYPVKARRPATPAPAEERFWRYVAAGPNCCWIWTGVLRKGYGALTIDKRLAAAHRFAYEMLVGPIPAGKQIDHVKARGCTSTRCVNPAHLEPVTPRINQLRGDSVSGVNSRKTHCDRGHELTGPNMRFREGGKRTCRTCCRDAARRYRERLRAKGASA